MLVYMKGVEAAPFRGPETVPFAFTIDDWTAAIHAEAWSPVSLGTSNVRSARPTARGVRRLVPLR